MNTWNPRISGLSEGFNYIDLSSVDQATKVITRVTEIFPEEAPSRARQIVASGDVLVATVRPNLNAVAEVPLELDSATASTGFCILRTDPRKLDSRYLYHWVRTDYFVREMVRLATGASYPAVSDRIVKNSLTPFPEIAEQKRIAAILDKADAIRRKRQQALDLADQFLRSVFLDMFGDPARLPGNRVKLVDVVLVDAPMVDPREEPYLDMLHFGPDRIEKNTGILLPALTAREESLISKKFLFDERYVLYSKIRPYLRKCALAECNGLCSADMYPIRPVDGKLTREFLWRLLLSNGFTGYTESLPGRANIPKLNRNELSAFEFSLPNYEVQEEFSGIVKKLGVMKNLLMVSDEGSNDVFDSINQKAFAGKL